jgi:hypothetical protein
VYRRVIFIQLLWQVDFYGDCRCTLYNEINCCLLILIRANLRASGTALQNYSLKLIKVIAMFVRNYERHL